MNSYNKNDMDRRDFIKKSTLAASGGLMLTTPLGRMLESPQEDDKHSPSSENELRVLLINGSPHAKGNTYLALSEASKTLEDEGIATEVVHIGVQAVRGCIACNQCHQRSLGRCVFDDDICNRIVEKMGHSDGLIIGSPVYYGQPNGSVLSLVQRMFYCSGDTVRNKPAAGVCVCRRGGATAAFQTLNMPFQMMNMPVVSSQYWNILYGMSEGEASLDREGMQTMRTLAHNMAWLLKKIHAGGNPDYPKREQMQAMNFIR